MALEIKAPSANDRTVNLTIPKAKDPYFVEWFQATKQGGENINQFLLRILQREVIQYFVIKSNQEDADAARLALQNSITILTD